jgi:LysM repeat protein
MSGIAKHFNVALKTLLTLNNLTEDSVIEIGLEIVVPEEKILTQ